MLQQLLVSGIAQGAIYGFMALSLTIIYRAAAVINFGHGEFFMLSAYVLYLFAAVAGLPYLVAGLTTLAFLCLLGVAIERLFVRRLAQQSHLTVAMMTVAIGYMLRGSVRYIWGRDIFQMPSPFEMSPMLIGTAVVTADDIAIMATVVVSVTLLCGLFYLTRTGKLVQAMYQSPRGARLVGMNLPAFYAGIWALAAGMAAIAGMLISPVTLVHPDMGANIFFRGLAAMTLGGIGSLPGALVGGLILGLFEQLGGGYVSSLLIDIAPHLIIVVVLVLRPNGLFGRAKLVRV